MGCEATVKPGGMCGAAHCTQYIKSSDAKAYCDCIDYNGKYIAGCTKKGANEPTSTNECYNKKTMTGYNWMYEECLDKIIEFGRDTWEWRVCKCCCSCVGWYTQVLIDEGRLRFVQDIEKDDVVRAASVTRVDGGLQLAWQQRVVDFSDGVSPNPRGQDMIRVVYKLAEQDVELIATQEQPFLMPDGQLRRADKLLPGDSLVRDDGTLAPVVFVGIVLWTGGIHHVATAMSESEPPTVDGHLISTNGVVAGDYWLQMLVMTGEGVELVEPEDERAAIGSQAYGQADGVRTTLFAATLDDVEVPASANPYVTAREEVAADAVVPWGARSYFTPAQMRALRRAPHSAAAQQKNVASFYYLKELFEGFFPDVDLYLQWEDDEPNLYTFTAYGRRTLYVSGRLLRLNAMWFEGLAAMLAHGIVILTSDELSGAPRPCTAVADYYGLGYVLKRTFNVGWSPVATDGFDQLKEVFGFIVGDDRDEAGDGCLRPSVDCRLKSLGAALSGFELPACARGPVEGGLRLEGVEVQSVTPTVLLATFNEAVDFRSAANVINYRIMPEVAIDTALRDAVDPRRVVLTVTLPDPRAGEYVVTVSDVRADDGSTLSRDARSAGFSITTTADDGAS